MRHITDEERRTRLARRHAIAPGHRVPTASEACASVGVLHATEPATVYLSIAARSPAQVVDVDAVLYDERSLVRQLAMRRTLFVFPRELLPAAWGSASERTAVGEWKKLLKDLGSEPAIPDPEHWLRQQRLAVLDLLRDGRARSAADIRSELPALDLRIGLSAGDAGHRGIPIGPRILTWLGARAELMRAHNQGHWRTSRPKWTLPEFWLGEQSARHQALPAVEGYAELVRVWLARFGPGTEVDIAWWLGGTKAATRAALAQLSAVAVRLDGEDRGWVLPDDLEPEPEVRPWAALLPVLDPTTMGWKERDFYLDPALVAAIFDRNGNSGTTAWLNGRIVGCWVQDGLGQVVVKTLIPVSAAERSLLENEAQRLSQWLAGEQVSTVYKSPAMKEASGALNAGEAVRPG